MLGQKHRTSWAQTSVLSVQNLRTLWLRSPMFPVFRPEMALNSLFLILRYFGARQVMVASDALLGPLTTWSGRLDASENGRWKILHTCPFFYEIMAFWLQLFCCTPPMQKPFDVLCRCRDKGIWSSYARAYPARGGSNEFESCRIN